MSEKITDEELQSLIEKADEFNDESAARQLIQMYDDGDTRIPEDFIDAMKERFWGENNTAESEENASEASSSEASVEGAEGSQQSQYEEAIIRQHKEWKAGDYAKKPISDLLMADDDPYALWQTARLYQKSGSLEKAISAYASADDILNGCLYDPEIISDAFNLKIEYGNACIDVDQSSKASDIYNEALELATESSAPEDLAKLFDILDKNPDMDESKKEEITETAKKQAVAGTSSFPIAFRLMTELWEGNDSLIAQAIAEQIVQHAETAEEKACGKLALSVMQNKEVSVSNDITGPYYKIAKYLFVGGDVSLSELSEVAEEADKLSGGVISAYWKPLKDKIASLTADKEQKEAEQTKTAARKEENKKIRSKVKLVSAIGIAVILVIAAIIFLINRPTKVDPFDYITVTPAGLNGYGYVETSVNYNQLSADLKQDVTEDNIVLSYTPNSDLKNGDTVKVMISEKGLKKVKLTNTKEEIPVSDLPDGKAVDAFADLDVTFAGVDGSGVVKIANNSSDPLLKNATYDYGSNSGSLKSGDTVTITVSVSNDDILKYLEYPKETSKTYTVSDLGSYVSDINSISDDDFNKLVSDEQESAVSAIKGSKYGLTTVFEGDYWYQGQYDIDSIELSSAYLISGNDNANIVAYQQDNLDNTDNNVKDSNVHNRIVLIYAVKAKPLVSDEQRTSYLKMIVNNVITLNGSIIDCSKENADFESDEHIAYQTSMDIQPLTEDDLYNKYVSPYKASSQNTITQRQ